MEKRNKRHLYDKPGHFSTLIILDRTDMWFLAMLLKLFNRLIYMSVTDSSLTEIISSAVVIAMQSQLKDYVSTGVGAKHNREAQQCLCE